MARTIYMVLCIMLTNWFIPPVLAQDEFTVSELFTRESNDTTFVLALKSKAFEYAFINTDTAKILAQKGIDLAKKIGYAVGEGQASSSMGIAYSIQGDYYSALQYFLRSRDIYDSIQDERRVAQALSYCATVYQELGDSEKSLKTRAETVPIQIKLNDLKGLAFSYTNIAILHLDSGRPDSALFFYNQSMRLFDSVSYEYGIAIVHKGLSRVYRELDESYLSIFNAEQAIKLLEKNNVNHELAEAYLNLGLAYESFGESNKSIEFYNKALSLASNINARVLLMNVYRNIFQWYEKVGKHKQALQFYKSHIALKDSIFSDKQLKELAILQARDNEIKILNENNLLKQKEITAQTKFRNFLLVGVFSILVLSIFLYRNYLQNIKHNKELQSKNEEIELKNIEISKEKEVADKASTIKTQFLTTMSHEIRTPLNAMIGHSHLLLQQKPRDDQEENLKALSFAGEHLLILVNDILDFSKFEAGKIEFEEIEFSLVNLISAIKHIQILKANEKGINLGLNIHHDVPKALIGDPTRLAQILNNLLSNSVKFTEKGSVTLDITLISQGNDTADIRFSVEDTGIGIPEDRLEDIFKSFEQVSAMITTKYGGTGLGLAITKKLVEQQGGNIEVKSKHGQGSTFWFNIPFKVSSAKIEKPAQFQHRASFKSLKGIHVLIAEDNLMNEKLCLKFLGNWNVTSDVARNGLEAIELAKKNEYDLILMDLQMPEMDGLEATEQIRNLNNTKLHNIPVIALTASTMPETKQKAREVGMVDFISKPFNPNELYNKIEKYARRKDTIYI